MNKKAFTLVELLATIVVIGLIMSIILPSAMRVSDENKDSMYESYEQMMEEYAAVSKYKNQFYVELDDLDNLEQIKKDCDGYVLIDHEENENIYTAYISCGSEYETEGYVDEASFTKLLIDVPRCKSNVIYNGQQQDLIEPNPGVYSLNPQTRKDVGTQNVTVAIVNKGRYAWSDDNTQGEKLVRNCEIKKRTITVTAPNVMIRRRMAIATINLKEEGRIDEGSPYTSDLTYKLYNSSNTEVAYNNLLPVGFYTIVPVATVGPNYDIRFVNGTLEVKNGTFLFSLNNQGATIAGTTGIYELYTEGWYSDENATNKITSITKPTKSNSTFYGYYTQTNGAGTQYINSSGTITGPTTSEQGMTLYAYWKTNGSISFTNSSVSLTYGNSGSNGYTYNGNGTLSCKSSDTSKVTCSVDTTNKKINLTTVGATSSAVTITLSATETSSYTATGNKTFTVTVGKRTLNVKADNKSKYQSQANPTLTYTYSGQVSGQTPAFSGSITTSATASSAVGTYPITQGSLALANGSGGFVAANYQISFTNGTLTINNPCTSTSKSCGNYGGCSVTYTHQTGTKTRSCQNYSTIISGYKCGSAFNESASCTGATNACGSTYKSCGNYGGCSVTYTHQTGTKTRSCQNYSNYISNYKCGSAFNESASCTGATNACSSTYKSCGGYGGCSVTYKDETGSMSRSCQNYSNYISNYKCGSAYTETASCNGASKRNCSCWITIGTYPFGSGSCATQYFSRYYVVDYGCNGDGSLSGLSLSSPFYFSSCYSHSSSQPRPYSQIISLNGYKYSSHTYTGAITISRSAGTYYNACSTTKNITCGAPYGRSCSVS